MKLPLAVEKRQDLINEIKCHPFTKLFSEIFDEIEQLPLHVQNTSIRCFLRVLMLSMRLNHKKFDWLSEQGLWKELFQLRNPILRTQLTSGLFTLDQMELVKGNHGFTLLAIPFFQMQKLGVDKDRLQTLAQNLVKKFKKPHLVQKLLQAIHLLANSKVLTDEQKVAGFDKIFAENNLLQGLTAAIGLLQIENTQWTTSVDDLVTQFRASFDEYIPLEGFEGDVPGLYDKFFGSSRHPYGLLTYASGLKKLKNEDVIPCLSRFVKATFEGNFKTVRYATVNNLHLNKIAEKHSEVLVKWQSDREQLLCELVRDNEKEEVFDKSKWLEHRLITDGHIKNHEFPYLKRYLSAKTDEERSSVCDELHQHLQFATKQQQNHEHREKQQKKELSELILSVKKDPKVALLKLQQACIAFAKAEPKCSIQKLDEITNVLNHKTEPPTLWHESEFAGDVKQLRLNLTKGNNATIEKDWKVTMVDDPVDLLFCGTDVNDSCQRVNGNPELNCGLLGYLMDGKNRLVAIKDSNGRIAARCLLRLMWDGENPVLYQERIYPSNTNGSQKVALNTFCKQVAEDLKIPFTTGNGNILYGKALKSLGGPAPFEYCDAVGGIQDKGVFTIPKERVYL
jgi:hypothetical protein